VMEGLDPALAYRLTQAYRQLRPWPEAPQVLTAIAATMPIGTVTNCSEELGRQAADLVGVPFEVIVTAQSAGAYKPQPEPYQRALDTLALPAERVLFVAGSPYDIPGASQIGMDVWWHNRAGMPAHPGPRPIAEHGSLNPLPAFASGLTTARPTAQAADAGNSARATD
jgi:2-haloacid dehalogenase